jgi:hypothetical protein
VGGPGNGWWEGLRTARKRTTVTLRGVLELLARREAKSNCLQKGPEYSQGVLELFTKVRQRVTVYKRDLSTHRESWNCSQK